MRLTPLDIREQQFRRVMRGLDPEEVSAFLGNVSEEFEALLGQNKELRERVGEFDEKLGEYRNMEKALRDTLLTAERVMTESKESAQREAGLIVREAELAAQRATARIGQDILEMRRQLAELRKVKDGYLARVRWLMRSQLEMIEVYGKDLSDVDADLVKEMQEQPASPPEAHESRAPQSDPPPEQIGTPTSSRAKAGSEGPGIAEDGQPRRVQARARSVQSRPGTGSTQQQVSSRAEHPDGSASRSPDQGAQATGTAAPERVEAHQPAHGAEGWSGSTAETMADPGDVKNPRGQREAAYDGRADETQRVSRSAGRSRRDAKESRLDAPTRPGTQSRGKPAADEIGWSVDPETAAQSPEQGRRAGEAGWSMQQFRDLLPDSEPKGQ